MHYNPELIKLIHENFWRIANFAYGSARLTEVLDERFDGGWPSLQKGLSEISEVAADRSLLELATHLRVLDDQEELNEYFQKTKAPELGLVLKEDGASEPLFFRDFTNKVIHAERFEWSTSADPPTIKCCGRDPSRWVEAEISVERIMFYVGQMPL